MLSRIQKEQIVKGLEDDIAAAQGVLFSDYSGLRVAHINELRAKVKKQEARIKVVRKTLLARAFAKVNIASEAIDALPGQVAVIFAMGDPITAAKACAVFKKKYDSFRLTGAFIGGALLSAAEAEQFSKLPGFQDLRAKFVGTLAAPLFGLVRALNWPIQSLVYVLSAKEK